MIIWITEVIFYYFCHQVMCMWENYRSVCFVCCYVVNSQSVYMYMLEFSSGWYNRKYKYVWCEDKQLLLITNNVSMYDSEVVCFLHVFRIFIYYKAIAKYVLYCMFTNKNDNIVDGIINIYSCLMCIVFMSFILAVW